MDQDILSQLKEKYNEFNEKYFRGILPNIPFKLARIKNSTAEVRYNVMRPKNMKPSYIDGSMVMVFTNKYQHTFERLIPVLLHEMIHVYLIAIENDVEDNHGVEFHRIRKELEQKSGMDIPVTDTVPDEIALSEPIKTYAVILRYLNDGKLAYAFISANTVKNKLPDIKKSWSRDKVEVRLVSSERWTRKAANMPIQRNIGYKTKFYFMNDADRQDLLDNSEVLWTNQ